MSIIWKDFIYSDIYEVSNTGLIKNKSTGKCLKPYLKKSGYVAVYPFFNKKQKEFLLHRLVALHFINNSQNKPQINHKNGNKQDNSILNLEWVTAKENVQHSYSSGLKFGRKGVKHHNSKLSETDILEIKKLLTAKVPQFLIGEMFDVKQQQISKINTKKRWGHI